MSRGKSLFFWKSFATAYPGGYTVRMVKFLSTREVAARLGVIPRRVRQLKDAGRLIPHPFPGGDRLIFTPREVARYLRWRKR